MNAENSKKIEQAIELLDSIKKPLYKSRKQIIKIIVQLHRWRDVEKGINILKTYKRVVFDLNAFMDKYKLNRKEVGNITGKSREAIAYNIKMGYVKPREKDLLDRWVAIERSQASD